MPTKAHEAAIQRVLADFPGAVTRRFRAAINELLREEGVPHYFDPHLIPDAYLVDVENRAVAVYEVEVTHPVSERRMKLYRDLWWMLDEAYWDLVLVQMDRYGNYAKATDVRDEVMDHIVKACPGAAVGIFDLGDGPRHSAKIPSVCKRNSSRA